MQISDSHGRVLILFYQQGFKKSTFHLEDGTEGRVSWLGGGFRGGGAAQKRGWLLG